MTGKRGTRETLEIEVKIPIGETAGTLARLRSIGAAPVRDRHLEENFLFDFPEMLITRRGCLLRVRRTPGMATLTFKGRGRVEKGAKVRSEKELVVEDAGACIGILESIGLKKIYRYEKYRTEYRHSKVEIAIDELPFGNFMELEGPHREIRELADRLQVPPERFLSESYRALHAAHQTRIGEPMGDLLFKKQAGNRASDNRGE